ncbi:hypothetical protein CVN76_12715 [Bacillus sp. mrc49]|nr:hypothetical protein CVN76_12715 [Bacillus sp. mrc49]
MKRRTATACVVHPRRAFPAINYVFTHRLSGKVSGRRESRSLNILHSINSPFIQLIIYKSFEWEWNAWDLKS